MHPPDKITNYGPSTTEEGIGCRNSCLIHLMILSLLGLAMLIWAVRNRVWELEVIVEMPKKTAEPEEPESTIP